MQAPHQVKGGDNDGTTDLTFRHKLLSGKDSQDQRGHPTFHCAHPSRRFMFSKSQFCNRQFFWTLVLPSQLWAKKKATTRLGGCLSQVNVGGAVLSGEWFRGLLFRPPRTGRRRVEGRARKTRTEFSFHRA